MSTYLVVAHQTLASPELIETLGDIAGKDAGAEFALLVPATPVSHLLAWEEGESRELARRRAAEAREILEGAGLAVVRANVGDHLPMDAVTADISQHPDYAGIIVSTFPTTLSRWLKMDLPQRLQRAFPDIPVRHIIAEPGLAVPAAIGGGRLGDTSP